MDAIEHDEAEAVWFEPERRYNEKGRVVDATASTDADTCKELQNTMQRTVKLVD